MKSIGAQGGTVLVTSTTWNMNQAEYANITALADGGTTVRLEINCL